MLKIIFHTIWNQRIQNIWIMIELILVVFFLWNAVESIAEITSNALISDGYDASGLYFAKLNMYNKSSSRYDSTLDNDLNNRTIFLHAIDAIKQCPEVSEYGVAYRWASIPNSLSAMHRQIVYDTLKSGTLTYVSCNEAGGDLMKTIGYTDATTGQLMHINNAIPSNQAIYISEQLAEHLFKQNYPIGKKTHFSNDSINSYIIAGVFKNIKNSASSAPSDSPLIFDKKLKDIDYSYAIICFRIKRDVNAKIFEDKFKHNIAPKFSTGNFYSLSLTSMNYMKQHYLSITGTTNIIRLQTMMSCFFLICVFLGMIGSFWIRCNNRRGDIGVMKASGCTTKHIVSQFILEASIIVTAAFILSMIWKFNVLHAKDYFKAETENYPYLVFHPAKMFAMTTLITYIIMLIIALLGTYIPVKRAAKILPAEAMREE